MRNTTLLCLLCSGMLLCNTSCSKDDEDDYTPRKPVVDETDYSLIDLTKYKFSGAELYTKESFTYGRFEARMKMAYAPGCISSMFLYYNDSYKGGGKVWNEIDIEVIGKDPNSFQSNLIRATNHFRENPTARLRRRCRLPHLRCRVDTDLRIVDSRRCTGKEDRSANRLQKASRSPG